MENLRTPFYDWHVAHRARMVPFGGWDMPVQFQGIIEEHKAVRNRVGWFDISHMGRLDFHGKDALSFLELVCTNYLTPMKVHQVKYSLICGEDAGILDDVLVYRFPDYWGMVVNASNRLKILNWFGQHKKDQDVSIVDRTLETAMIAIQGPQAIPMCESLFPDPIAPVSYYYSIFTQFQNQPCLVSRTGYTGEDGIEIACDAKLGLAIVEELTRRGIPPIGLGARDTLRLEAAMPLYGHELTEEYDPSRAGLMWAVKPREKYFIGKDGFQRTRDIYESIRVGLELEGKRAAREGCTVLLAGKPIGKVTSGSFAPTLEKSIAMAYIDPHYKAVGTSVMVDIRGTLTPAQVVALPFYQRAK